VQVVLELSFITILKPKKHMLLLADIFGVACLLFQLFTFANLFSERRSRHQQTDIQYLTLSKNLLPPRFHAVFMQMMCLKHLDCGYYLEHPAFQLIPEDEECAKIQLRALIQNASERKPLLDAKAKEEEEGCRQPPSIS